MNKTEQTPPRKGGQLELPLEKGLAENQPLSWEEKIQKAFPDRQAFAPVREVFGPHTSLHFRIVKRGGSSSNPDDIIYPRYEHKVLPFDSFRDCVEAAIRDGVSLKNADLSNPYHLAFIEKFDLDKAPDLKKELNARASLRDGFYEDGDFENVMAQGVDFSGSKMARCHFHGHASPQQVRDNNLSAAMAELEYTKFNGCDLTDARFENAVLNNAEFAIAYNYDTEKTNNAVLNNACFTSCELHGTSIRTPKCNGLSLDKSNNGRLSVDNIDFNHCAAGFHYRLIGSSSRCKWPDNVVMKIDNGSLDHAHIQRLISQQQQRDSAHFKQNPRPPFGGQGL